MANPTARYTLPDWIDHLSEEYAIKLLLLGFFGTNGPPPGGGGGIVVNSEMLAEATAAPPLYAEGQDAPLSQDLAGNLRTLMKYPSGTLHVFAKTAGETETIPVGAFQIGIIFLTGTGTIGGVDWPVGVPFNIEARTAATIAVVCANPGTARINYLT